MHQQTTETAPAVKSTKLRAGSIGVFGIVLFVMSAQAPLAGLAGAAPLAIGLGNGAAAPLAYLLVGIIIIIFAVGYTAMNKRVKEPGAFYAYITLGIGRKAGAGSSWLAMLAYTSIQAAMYGLLGGSTSELLRFTLGWNIPWWMISLLAMAFVLFLGSRSIEAGARFVSSLVIAEFAIILIFAFVVLFQGGGPEGLDLGASFSPSVFMVGAPGIAIMFAVASMFGFESTAIYSAEAKDPAKTVARATYVSVAIISVFFAFVIWLLVSYYGASNVVDAAFAALESGDSTQFLFGAMDATLGPWAGLLGTVLLVTSVLVGLIAFHNIVNRYFHSLGVTGSLPRQLARTNKHDAPHVAAVTQTVTAFVIVMPFAVLGLDPILTLFSWFSGLGVAALVSLYLLSSVAIILHLRRETEPLSVWRSTIAPVIAGLAFVVLLVLIVSNFTELIGGSALTATLLLLTVPVLFVVGVIVDAREPRRS